MAITTIDYALFEDLKQRGVLPPSPRLLEFGEPNWYGDVRPMTLGRGIYEHVQDADRRRRLFVELDRLFREQGQDWQFEVVDIFWEAYLAPSERVTIDLHGRPRALRHDLNEPLDLDGQFDVVYNTGTAEHVFNVFQFFKTTHDLTRPGGVMVHAAPFTGWYDHGFYNFQPTFWLDLAATNRYRVDSFLYAEIDSQKALRIARREQLIEMAQAGELGPNGLLYAVFLKGEDEGQFVIPRQGYYAGRLSEQARDAWHAMR